MALKIIFLEEFGKSFVPKKLAPTLKKYMLKADFSEVPYRFFGLLFYFSAFITTLIFILYIFPCLNNPSACQLLKGFSIQKFSLLEIYIFSFLSWSALQIFFASSFALTIYFYLDLKIYYRTKKMEDNLPEFLQVLSANLKGGMTFERALWSSIKPKFNVLGSEMAKTSKKVMTGYDTSRALAELAEKYDSLMLRRTVDLIISEVDSGGNVSELIDRLVDNLKETKSLKDEMSGSAIAYVIFISIIVVFISPLLFALSFNLLNILLKFMGKLSASTQNVSALPLVFSKPNVNVNDFRKFSIVALVVISFFSSLIVAIVEKGEIKQGIKYIPMYVIGSIGFYFFFMKLLGGLFTGLV